MLNGCNQNQEKYQRIILTVLEELESVGDAGLIGSEKKSSTMLCLSSSILFCCHLRSKLNPPSHDSTGLNRNGFDRGRRNFKVVSWVGFPDVRSKWTIQLGASLPCEKEVVVSV